MPVARSTSTCPPAFTASLLTPRRLESDRITTFAGAPPAANRSKALTRAAGSAMPVFGASPWALTATKARPARTTMQLALVHVAGELMTNLLKESDPPFSDRIRMVWFAREEVAGVRQGFGRFRVSPSYRVDTHHA